MSEILKEMSDSAKNILNFSRNELKRGSQLDNNYTDDGYATIHLGIFNYIKSFLM